MSIKTELDLDKIFDMNDANFICGSHESDTDTRTVAKYFSGDNTILLALRTTTKINDLSSSQIMLVVISDNPIFIQNNYSTILPG